MPRTIRTKVYQYNELSEQAKEKARDWYRGDGYDSCDWIISEAMESFKEFAEIFGIKHWEIDLMEFYRCSYRLDQEDHIKQLTGQRLATFLWNNFRTDLFKGKYYGKLVSTFKDGTPIPISKEHPIGQRHVKRYSKCTLTNDCVLTGACYDMDLLEPIYQQLARPGTRDTFAELISECIKSLCKSVEREINFQNEDEQVAETIIANEYEFTVDGKRF